MTVEEKFINSIRNYLIEVNGKEFLQLSEEKQNDLIIATIQEYINKVKN
jgi:hypothetical protein